MQGVGLGLGISIEHVSSKISAGGGATNYILLESGFSLLMEDGSHILMES